MPQISSSEFRARLAEALGLAQSGEPVVITHHGKPAAALIAADQLAQLESTPGASPPAKNASPTDTAPNAGDASPPTPEQLLKRAAAPTWRRLARDFERLPEDLRPVLQMIRDNLFQPQLTVERIRRTLSIGANDLTTQFGAATGATIRKYLEDRRLECAARLLVDTELDVETLAHTVGYRKREVFSRAFQRRYGVRPPVYRTFGGQLSREALETTRPGPTLPAPRYLAGVAPLAPNVPCALCGKDLDPEPILRVFDDLTPLCDDCARTQAPDLADLLTGERDT